MASSPSTAVASSSVTLLSRRSGRCQRSAAARNLVGSLARIRRVSSSGSSLGPYGPRLTPPAAPTREWDRSVRAEPGRFRRTSMWSPRRDRLADVIREQRPPVRATTSALPSSAHDRRSHVSRHRFAPRACLSGPDLSLTHCFGKSLGGLESPTHELGRFEPFSAHPAEVTIEPLNVEAAPVDARRLPEDVGDSY